MINFRIFTVMHILVGLFIVALGATSNVYAQARHNFKAFQIDADSWTSVHDMDPVAYYVYRCRSKKINWRNKNRDYDEDYAIASEFIHVFNELVKDGDFNGTDTLVMWHNGHVTYEGQSILSIVQGLKIEQASFYRSVEKIRGLMEKVYRRQYHDLHLYDQLLYDHQERTERYQSCKRDK